MEYHAGSGTTPRTFFYHLVKFRREEVERVHVNGGGFIGTSKYFWKSRGNPDIVINGDEGFYEKSPVLPKGYGVSDGQVYKNTTVESCVQWDKSHQLLGMSDRLLPGAFNVCGGSNMLLSYGEIPEWLDGKPSVDPRTSLFWDETYYYIIVIDGRNNGTLGLTLKELAEFALSLGARNGHNLDGGDSCQLLLNENGIPIIKNNLPDGTLHGVVNHIGFWLKDGISVPEIPIELPEGETKMEEVIKTVRKRTGPSFYQGYEPKDPDAVQGYQFESAESKVVAEEIPAGSNNTYAVVWEKLPDGKWVPRNHYNNGDVYLKPLGEPEPDPDPEPVRKIVDIDVNYDDGTSEKYVKKPA